MAVSAAEAGRNERMHAWAMHTLFSKESTDAQFLLKLDGTFIHHSFIHSFCIFIPINIDCLLCNEVEEIHPSFIFKLIN